MVRKLLAGACLMLALTGTAAAQQTAICYNCPEEWADWGSQLRAIKQRLGIAVPFDNKNSGQVVTQLIAEKANPVADVAYYGVTFGIQAQKAGLVEPYKPAKLEDVPADLRDPGGTWFTIHSGTVGFFINKDALGGKPVPKSWKDLQKPEYSGLVGYYDPTSAFVGYMTAMAVNVSLGGSLEDFAPALTYFKELKKNAPIVVNQTSYARVVSGEIPILVDTDFNAYRAKYKDKVNAEFVIPAEGSLAVPYVMSLVKGSPHAENGKKILDFVLSDEGQALWANAYLRPVRASALSKEAAAKFLPESDYARVKPIDFDKLGAVQKSFSERFLAEAR
jgi:putative spermidine/putrescine transport system substrate-binding protein